MTTLSITPLDVVVAASSAESSYSKTGAFVVEVVVLDVVSMIASLTLSNP